MRFCGWSLLRLLRLPWLVLQTVQTEKSIYKLTHVFSVLGLQLLTPFLGFRLSCHKDLLSLKLSQVLYHRTSHLWWSGYYTLLYPVYPVYPAYPATDKSCYILPGTLQSFAADPPPQHPRPAAVLQLLPAPTSAVSIQGNKISTTFKKTKTRRPILPFSSLFDFINSSLQKQLWVPLLASTAFPSHVRFITLCMLMPWPVNATTRKETTVTGDLPLSCMLCVLCTCFTFPLLQCQPNQPKSIQEVMCSTKKITISILPVIG